MYLNLFSLYLFNLLIQFTHAGTNTITHYRVAVKMFCVVYAIITSAKGVMFFTRMFLLFCMSICEKEYPKLVNRFPKGFFLL